MILLPVPSCAMPGLGLIACALLCDPWCGVLVSWWVVSGLLCGPTACTLAVRCLQLDDTCDPNVCDAWCLGSSYPGLLITTEQCLWSYCLCLAA